ncbi:MULTISPECIES: SpoVR family protein [unclassified Neptuniibacter]|uniref:SpoVR family protein n=1 Tax=unclassified Neptuniibacter TaxID=2630693 RepID=UPI0025CCB4FA|nr:MULTISPECIES: SpoVR family protein [unclassified Neptuniibacter]|tara:strand:+ start:17930 stop:19453 length:1524 start_codon:yes stop_codon:yes gene_type:complete
MKKKPISTGSEWTFDLIAEYDKEIGRIAAEFGLDTYPNQIEVITSEQMMDAYASIGMPLNYNHWSFGKQFVETHQNYKRGRMGLAYEIVINSDPCISYLMEENTITMQALVIAHACYGHNSFFKGNYLFKTWTDASAIIDYLLFAKSYISHCEERYGVDAVEELLDSCHALMNYGVNRYMRPQPLTTDEEKERQQAREEYIQRHINDLWNTIPKKEEESNQEAPHFPKEPEENILYFIEKNAPLLEPWQREIVRIVRKVAQYFYPQKQTQVMNEGWACFWHYTLLHQLHNEGLASEGFMMEFLHSHTSVVYQPPFDSPYFNGINPYTLGYNMMQDIKRICENPTEEDREWFPEIAGSDWKKTLDYAMRNYKDESFILQYLSPHLIRELHLFTIMDNSEKANLAVTAIHNESGYRQIREDLAAQYNLGNREPNIQIFNVDVRGDRSLTLRHFIHNKQPLSETSSEVLRHIHRLWGFDIHLESVFPDGTISKSYHCPEQSKDEEPDLLT